MPHFSTLKFPSVRHEFLPVLNKRVNDYFKTNNISRHANGEMVFKTIFMYAYYFVPMILILTGVVTNVWAMLLLCLLAGCGMAGIGLSIMHDANHGAYSNKNWVNNLIGYSLNLIGGHAFN